MAKTKPTVLFKKKSILLIVAFLIGCFVCACGKEDSIVDESLVEDTEDVSSTEDSRHRYEQHPAVHSESGGRGYPLRRTG